MAYKQSAPMFSCMPEFDWKNNGNPVVIKVAVQYCVHDRTELDELHMITVGPDRKCTFRSDKRHD